MLSLNTIGGGSSSEVHLYDIRMDGAASSSDSGDRIVQTYRPKEFCHDTAVSVSGLDITKDGKELLVSYENDQVRPQDACVHLSRTTSIPLIKVAFLQIVCADVFMVI